jgi:putative membrane protein
MVFAKLTGLIRALLLLGFGYFLMHIVSSGDVLLYIHPRFILGLKISYWFFYALALAQLINTLNPQEIQNHGFKRGWGMYVIFIVPLVIGLLIPPKALSSYMVNQKGINLTNNQQISGRSVGSATVYNYAANWNPVITNNTFMYAMYMLALQPQSFVDKKIDFVGFVYKNKEFRKNQFLVARFAITCCTADAQVLGLMCIYDNADAFAKDDWVRVKGIIKTQHDLTGAYPTVEVSSIEKVPPPKMPYVF